MFTAAHIPTPASGPISEDGARCCAAAYSQSCGNCLAYFSGPALKLSIHSLQEKDTFQPFHSVKAFLLMGSQLIAGQAAYSTADDVVVLLGSGADSESPLQPASPTSNSPAITTTIKSCSFFMFPSFQKLSIGFHLFNCAGFACCTEPLPPYRHRPA